MLSATNCCAKRGVATRAAADPARNTALPPTWTCADFPVYFEAKDFDDIPSFVWKFSYSKLFRNVDIKTPHLVKVRRLWLTLQHMPGCSASGLPAEFFHISDILCLFNPFPDCLGA